MIKQWLYLCVAVAFLYACNADQLLTEGSNKPKVTVMASLKASFAENIEMPKTNFGGGKTRTILGLETDEHGTITITPFMKEKQKVVCVFYHPTSNTIFKQVLELQPKDGSKTKTNPADSEPKPKYSDSHIINQNFEFNAEPTANLTTGNWYLMCFTSSNVSAEGALTVSKAPHFHGGKNFIDEHHYDGSSNRLIEAGEDFSTLTQSPDLEIPFATLWQKLDVAQDNNKLVFKVSDDKYMNFRMLGTLLKLSIEGTPADNFDIYNYTLISSGDTKGSLTVSLDDAKKIDPAIYTNNLLPTDTKIDQGFQQMIDLMWVGSSRKDTESKVSYTHYNLNDHKPTHYEKGGNQRGDVFWFMMQKANRGNEDQNNFPNTERYKTQFLCHAKYKPEEHGGGGGGYSLVENKKIPLYAMATYPFYGTKFKFKSGHYYEKYQSIPSQNYDAYMLPLTYALADKNLNTKDGWSPKGDAPGLFFSQAELKDIPDKDAHGYPFEDDVSDRPFPSSFYWQFVLPYNAKMEKNKPIMTYGIPLISNAFHAYYVWNHTEENGTPKYSHIVLRQFPRTMSEEDQKDVAYNRYVDPTTDYAYKKSNEKNDGLAYQNDVFGTDITERLNDGHIFFAGSDGRYPDKMATRIEYKDLGDATKARVVITQRFLGPNFILDPFDIDTDEYWKYLGDTGFTPLTPQGDATIELPLPGYVMEGETTPRDAGYGAIYWVRSSSNTGSPIDEGSGAFPLQDNTEPLVPLYFNLKPSSGADSNMIDWWRIGNTGTHREFYNLTDHTPKFKALVRSYRDIPSNRDLYKNK